MEGHVNMKHAVPCLWLCLYLMAGTITQLHAAKILLLPFNCNSHILHSAALGEGLIERGHQVDMVLSPNYILPQRVKNSAIRILYYNDQVEEKISMGDHIDGEFIRTVVDQDIREVSHVRMTQDYGMPYCHNILGDQELFRKLNTTGYNLVLVDGFSMVRCAYALVYRLDVPAVSFTTTYDPWLYRVPAMPSFVPFAMATDYSEKMSFMQRLNNIFLQLDWHVAPRMKVMQDSLVQMYVPEKPFKALNDIFRESLLVMLNSDPTLDYPRPSMPHVINNGGLTTAPAKPLSDVFKQFVDDADQGVILVSFGSIVRCLPLDYIERFLATFKLIKQRVIMRHCTNPDFQPGNVPDNVLLHDWLPQNDLLGHPKVKLFITHGGNNGQFEALYHGVPMISLPIFAEQCHNAKRIEYKGFGLQLKINTFTPDQLVTAIKEVLTNAKYTKNIRKASKIFKSNPTSPKELAMYWIEHVLQFGGSHLRSHALEMPWYEYLMLDILFFISVTLLLMAAILLKLICCCTRSCTLKKVDKTLKTE